MAEHPCPCCERTTFPEEGSYEICAICNWEDDPVQQENPHFEGGANDMSLNQAKIHWRLTGKPMPLNRTPEMSEALALVNQEQSS